MLVFITASMGAAINASMTLVSIIFTVFTDLLEFLITYIQAYVFTLLSAIFIGLARAEPHSGKKKVTGTGQAA
jgi:F-type H+-transporting ATPase subunit a